MMKDLSKYQWYMVFVWSNDFHARMQSVYLYLFTVTLAILVIVCGTYTTIMRYIIYVFNNVH